MGGSPRQTSGLLPKSQPSQAGAGKKGLSSNIKVIDNVFSRRVWPKGGHAGPVSYWDADGPGNVWKGNTWEDGRSAVTAD